MNDFMFLRLTLSIYAIDSFKNGSRCSMKLSLEWIFQSLQFNKQLGSVLTRKGSILLRTNLL